MIPNKEFSMKLSINKAINDGRVKSIRLIATIGCALLLTAGCASNQRVSTESLLAAEQAIDNAERARVSQYAAAELMQAREILGLAKVALTKKDLINANRLAQQSQVTAQLAFAHAELIKAEQINTEIKQSIEQLKQEMQRNRDANL